MKKLIIFLILSLYAVTAFAFFGSDKEEPEVVKPPENCHFALWVTGKEAKVYYIFKHPCGEISQVGIIDEPSQKIFTLHDLKIVDAYEYFGDTKRTEYIETRFPNLEILEIYSK